MVLAERGDWKAEMSALVVDGERLARALGLPTLGSENAEADFPLRVPPAFLRRIVPGDAGDPLLRQIAPVAEECLEVSGYEPEPLAESRSQEVSGVVRKYRGRALLLVTSTCAIHCRYCFRRHFPYVSGALSGERRQAAIATIAADPSIAEVILSGGDPWTLPDATLESLVADLEAVPHLRRLRVHTRMPIVVPSRVTTALLASLTGSRLAPVVVVHANHAREIDDEVAAALARIRGANVPLRNQAVLLRGGNDTVEALEALSERLFDAGVLPYYLHLLDPVAGAAHFEVGEAEGRALVRDLAERAPGYLVPRLVREVPGEAAKRILAPRPRSEDA